MKNILIFTGAGMSVPLGLPSTMDFMESVRTNAATVTNRVIDYLGPSGEDIEWLLSTLASFNNETPFTEFLLPHIAVDQHSKMGLPNTLKQLKSLKSQAVSEMARIKKIIFEKLSSYKQDQATSLYVNLVAELKAAYGASSISIITTNYDLTFESAIESSQDKWRNLAINNVDFGFSIQFGRPIYNASQDFNWSENTIEYLKLHGSVDWHRDANGRCSRSMSNTVPDDPDQMAILYPGYKGVPEIEPFNSMHGRLHKRLGEADHIVVIGFAFRDAYINNIFENTLRSRPDTRILYYNPLSVDAFPKDSLVPHLIRNYASFQHIQRGIGLSENSLELAKIEFSKN